MTHSVRFRTPICDLGKSNITLSIWRDDEKLGTLLVSRGAVVWRPKSGKKTFKMDWGRFDAMMKSGYRGPGE